MQPPSLPETRLTAQLPNLTCLAANQVDPNAQLAFERSLTLASVVAGVILLGLAAVLVLAYLRERGRRRRIQQAHAEIASDEAETAKGRQEDRRENRLLEAINTLLRQELHSRDETDLANAALAFAQEFTQSRFAMLVEPDGESARPLAIRDATGNWASDASVERVLSAQPRRLRELWSHATERGGQGGYARNAIDADADPGAFETMLVLPLRRQGELELVLLLGDAEDGYGPADLDDLGLLAVTYLEALGRCRSEQLINRYRRQLDTQATELKRSNEELEQFAYVASHDLQEPLRKITAFGDRLQASLGNQLDERTGLYLDRMIDAAGRMRNLIDDLLHYSRAGRGPLKPQRVDIEKLVDSLKDDVSIDGELQIELAGPIPPVRGNRTQLRLLLGNLLSNARKFRKPEQAGRVRVWAETVDGEQVRLCVRDEGIGIDQKFAERIFRPFQRLHSRSEYPGTGIGLAICQKIVRSHGGAISVHSQPGEGTRFDIVLPRWREKDSQEDSSADRSPSGADPSDQPMT